MTRADAQRPIRIVGLAGNPGRDLNDRVLMRATHERPLLGMPVAVFGSAAVPCADREIGHGKDQVGVAHPRLAGTAGAAPGTAWTSATDRIAGCG